MTNTTVEEIKILQCERLFPHCKRISYINRVLLGRINSMCIWLKICQQMDTDLGLGTKERLGEKMDGKVGADEAWSFPIDW